MNTSKIIKAYIGAGTYSTTEPITQGDYGYILQIEGAVLPATYRVDFANDRHEGEALTVYGNEDGAEVPKELIDTGKDIFAFYYYIGENFGKTAYTWKIPNDTRAKYGDRTPTPTQQDSIDQLIVRSNEAVEIAEQKAEEASTSAQSASDSAIEASRSESRAQTHALNAERSSTNADLSANDASESAEAAAHSANQAAQIKADVEGLERDARAAANSSETSARASSGFASQAQGFARQAESYANGASGYASQASESAQTASTKASEASQSATVASDKATEASQSASQALIYKNDAESAKTDSQTAQGLAEQARDDAQRAQAMAENAEANAESTVHGVLDSLSLVETSGSIIETHDAFPVSPEKMVVDINPVQDLHGYDSPWVGGGGKNLITGTEYRGSVYNNDVGGNLKLSSPRITYTQVSNVITITNSGSFFEGQVFATAMLPSGQYAVHYESDSADFRATIYIASEDFIVEQRILNTSGAATVSRAVTLDADARIVVALCNVKAGSIQATNLQVESGSAYTSWTPYENICPISGWTGCEVSATGKNLLALPVLRFNEVEATKANCFFVKAGTYMLQYSCDAEHRYGIRLLDMAGNVISDNAHKPNSSVPYNSSAQAYYAGINVPSGFKTAVCNIVEDCYVRIVSNQTGGGFTNAQFEKGSTATDYDPYTGRSITINLGQTVYGAHIDVLSGVLTIDRAMVTFDGSEDWAPQNGVFTLYLGDAANIYKAGTTSQQNIVIADRFKPNGIKYRDGCGDGNIIKVVGNNTQIACYSSVYSSIEAFKSSLADNPMQIVYILATPIEIQPTPQQIILLKDYNVLWADTGDISEFAYRAGEFATKADIPNVPVEDVQVNGSSVVQNKIANIDLTGIEENSTRIESLEDDRYKPYATDSASGAIASFPDGADNLPLKSLVVDIDPVQDLHGYDSPWVAGGGKNLFGGVFNQNFVFATPIPANTTIAVSCAYNSESSNVRINLYRQNGTRFTNYGINTISGNKQYRVITIEEDAYSVMFDISERAWYQIEIGSTATDYAPYENICPISGWTGANVEQSGVNAWDEELELGTITIDNGRDVAATDRLRSKNKTRCSPNTSYYLGNFVGTIFWYSRDGSYISFNYNNASDLVRTSPANAYWFRFAVKSSYGVAYNHDISINYPSTDHDYHPYVGQSIPINWQTEAGTVYDGSLDVLSGVMRVEMGMLDMSTASWTFNNTTKRATTNDIKNLVKIPSSQFVKSGSIAENYSEKRANATLTVGEFAVVQTGAVVLYYDGVNAPSGKLVYPLAEPIEIQLTPHEVNSLLGVNNIFADTGDTACEYRADTKLYINRLTEPDSDMVADSNIVSGQYFMVGNSLYKATANIANGGQIIVGTNATRVSIAQALNEINT